MLPRIISPVAYDEDLCIFPGILIGEDVVGALKSSDRMPVGPVSIVTPIRRYVYPVLIFRSLCRPGCPDDEQCCRKYIE
jgi:hypothetical protein